MGSKRYGGVPLLSKWANMTQGVATRTLRCSDRDKDTPFNIYGNFDDVLASVSKLAEFMTLRGNLVSNRRTWQMLNRAVQIKCSRAVFQELIDRSLRLALVCVVWRQRKSCSLAKHSGPGQIRPVELEHSDGTGTNIGRRRWQWWLNAQPCPTQHFRAYGTMFNSKTHDQHVAAAHSGQEFFIVLAWRVQLKMKDWFD